MSVRFLYSRSVADFLKEADVIENVLVAGYSDGFGRMPSDSERKSWQLSLKKLAIVLKDARLASHRIIFEYIPPTVGRNERADVVILGAGMSGEGEALIIENKNWPDQGIRRNSGPDLLTIGVEEKIHPSVQAIGYARQVKYYHKAFTGEVRNQVSSCVFLPFTIDSNHPVLNHNSFSKALTEAPIFYQTQIKKFREFIVSRLPNPPSEKFIKDFERSEYLPSAGLLAMAQGVFNGEPAFRLSEEQQRAYSAVAQALEEIINCKKNKKAVFVIKGGPGTGKSLIGLKLLGDFAVRLGRKICYAAGNASFQVNLAGSLSKALRDQNINGDYDFESIFTNFRAFGDELPNNLDLIICDEAQRLQPDSSTQYTKVSRSVEQTQEVISASRVSVFFIDENQRVRDSDIGSSSRINETANFLRADYREFNLISQFRCSQSERYIASLNHLFGVKGYESLDAPSSGFVFQVMKSPSDMEERLRSLKDEGNRCLMLAGYCWPWTKTKNKTEPLTPDVVIGDWARPWNRADNGGGKSYNRTNFGLVTDPARFNEIGCIHTAHGIEFDYVGVILGGDLIYRENRGWSYDSKRIFDRGFKNGITGDADRIVKLLKNIYRTLMSRGRLGCFIYSVDEETSQYISKVVRV